MDYLSKPQRITAGLIFLASALTIGFVFAKFIASITVAIFLYYCSRPIYRFMSKRTSENYISLVVTLFITLVPLLFLFVYTLRLTLTELTQVIIRFNLQSRGVVPEEVYNLNVLVSDSQNLDQFLQNPQEFEFYSELLDWSLVVIDFIGSLLLQFLVLVIVLSYFLLHDEKISSWFDTNISPLFKNWVEFTDAIDTDLQSVFLGNILNGIVTATLAIFFFVIFTFISPSQISLNYPVLLGILAGVASLIPVLGVKVVYGPTAVILVGQLFVTGSQELWPYIALFIIVSSVIIDFIPDMIIRPYITSKNVSTLLLLGSYIAGPVIFGWYGFFLAPIILIIIYNFDKYELNLPQLLSFIG